MYKGKLYCLLKTLFCLYGIMSTVYLLRTKEENSSLFSDQYRAQFNYVVDYFNIKNYPSFLSPKTLERNKGIVFDFLVYSNFVLIFLSLFVCSGFFLVYGLKHFFVTMICTGVIPLDLNDKHKLLRIAYSFTMLGISILLSCCKRIKDEKHS